MCPHGVLCRMTRKERILIVLISIGITALVLVWIWHQRPPEIPQIPPPVVRLPVIENGDPVKPPEVIDTQPRETTPIRIQLPDVPDGGSIQGKVVDAGGGPIHNATLTAIRDGQPVKYAFTDKEGIYVISGLAPGRYDIRAEREGYATAGRSGIQLSKLQKEVVDFELVRGGSFSGSVVDESEEPILNANVTLYASSARDNLQWLVRSFRARTNKDGGFRIDNVSPGEYIALAQHEAHIPSERTPFTIDNENPTTHKFVLETGGSVSGTVTDLDGGPVAGVQVWLSSVEDTIIFSRGARTDADGKYVLGGLKPGSVDIRTLAPGFVAVTKRDIQVFKGRMTEGIDFTLDPGKSISGVVVNSADEPVKNATISANDTKSYKTAKTDEKGQFALNGFSGDKVNLSVRAPGYVLFVKRNIPANTDELHLVLRKGGSVEGQAISDVVLKSFVVILYTIPEAGRQRRIVKQKISSDPEGYFKVKDIPGGIYTLEIHAKDYIQVSPETVEIREGTTVSGLEMAMRARR